MPVAGLLDPAYLLRDPVKRRFELHCPCQSFRKGLKSLLGRHATLCVWGDVSWQICVKLAVPAFIACTVRLGCKIKSQLGTIAPNICLQAPVSKTRLCVWCPMWNGLPSWAAEQLPRGQWAQSMALLTTLLAPDAGDTVHESTTITAALLSQSRKMSPMPHMRSAV